MPFSENDSDFQKINKRQNYKIIVL